MRYADCHPDLKHHCKGLCRLCYTRRMHGKLNALPGRKQANSARSKQWRLKNPEKSYELDANKHLFRKFGITLATYRIMLSHQSGVCALCKKPETIVIKKRVSSLAVDHCHKTGKIRGLLCFRCNIWLSLVDDVPGILKEVTGYLKGEKHEVQQ